MEKHNKIHTRRRKFTLAAGNKPIKMFFIDVQI